MYSINEFLTFDDTNSYNDDNGATLSLLVIELAYVIKTVVFSDHWLVNSGDGS